MRVLLLSTIAAPIALLGAQPHCSGLGPLSLVHYCCPGPAFHCPPCSALSLHYSDFWFIRYQHPLLSRLSVCGLSLWVIVIYRYLSFSLTICIYKLLFILRANPANDPAETRPNRQIAHYCAMQRLGAPSSGAQDKQDLGGLEVGNRDF